MSKASEKAVARAESFEALCALIAPGKVIHSIVRSVSQSGMSRKISLFVTDKDGDIVDISWHVARVLDYTLDRDVFALKVKGAGMDMCFHLVYSLGHAMFPDGFTSTGRGQHGTYAEAGEHVANGGYALRSRAL